jgi:hypothetical protein
MRREYHDFKPTLRVFPELNPDKMASDLHIGREAEERAKRNEPSPNSTGLDDFELMIVERVETAKNDAHNTLSEEMRVYDQRLARLEFEERFSAIRQAAPAAVGEFKAEAMKGRDELHALRRDVLAGERERDIFREKHGIDRLSRHSSGGTLTLKIGVLLLLAIVEIALNGAFLAKGSESGLVGGISEAVGFALLNIVVSFLIAAVGVRWLNHRNNLAKFLGLFSLVFYICFAIGLNLALAHYREVAGTLAEEAGREVVARITASPLGLSDLKSWLFFAIGLTFSVIAFGDAFLIFDPYPGFGSLYTRVDKAHMRYRQAKEALIENLEDIRNNAIETMQDANRDLSLRRGEHDAIIQGKERLNQLFSAYQDHLERTVNNLLMMYRGANTRARTDGQVPTHFTKRYTMDRIPLPALQGLDSAREDLRRSIADAQEALDQQVNSIHREFEATLVTYKQIDDMVGRNADVSPQIQFA